MNLPPVCQAIKLHNKYILRKPSTYIKTKTEYAPKLISAELSLKRKIASIPFSLLNKEPDELAKLPASVRVIYKEQYKLTEIKAEEASRITKNYHEYGTWLLSYSRELAKIKPALVLDEYV